MVRETVEETLTPLLDAEADQLCGAGRYVRRGSAGHPSWQLTSGCRPALARSISRFLSFGAGPLRRRSSNATAGGRAQSKKRSASSSDAVQIAPRVAETF